MHAYGITRGIKKEVDDFITQLQGKYLPFRVEKEGTAGIAKGDWMAQLQVRPIQLWEFVFPRRSKDIMLTTLFGPSGTEKQADIKTKNNEVARKATKHSRHDKMIWAIRKAIGAEKIPEYNCSQILPISKIGVDVVPIGIKEDYTFEDGTEAL